jgi:hypothetical protein
MTRYTLIINRLLLAPRIARLVLFPNVYIQYS